MLGSFLTPKSILSVRLEFQIAPNAKILSKAKNIGELKKRFSKLKFIKYIYPVDGSLKGVNPPDDSPLVPKAYITVFGTLSDIRELVKEATE